MAYYHKEKREFIPISTNQNAMPFYVSFTEEGVLFGEDAKRELNINQANTIYDLLHLIGRKYSDPEFQEEMKKWPFKIISDSDDKPIIETRIKDAITHYYPEEILTMTFKYLMKKATDYLTPHNKYKKVKETLIAVPSYLDKNQTRIIEDAATKANFHLRSCFNKEQFVLHILSEDNSETPNVVLIGIGSDSFSIYLYGNDGGLFDIISSYNNIKFGGDSFTGKIVDYFAGNFNKKFNCNINKSNESMMILKEECEKIKIRLSSEENVSISCKSIFEGHDLIDTISRSIFENICSDLFVFIKIQLDNFLKNANFQKNDVKKVIIFGGSSKIPAIQQTIKNYFDNLDLSFHENSDKLAIFGVSLFAHMYKKTSVLTDILLLDRLKLSFGIETADKTIKYFLPTEKDCYYKPKSFLFTTSKDNQTKVILKIFEGERIYSCHCHLIGTIELNGIEPAPKGIPQIEVTMVNKSFGNSDFIQIIVKDKKTGNYEKFVFYYFDVKLNDDEIDFFKSSSIEFKQKDEELKKEIEKKFELEKYCFNLRNLIENDEYKNNISLKEKDEINKEINDIFDWINTNKYSSIYDFER